MVVGPDSQAVSDPAALQVALPPRDELSRALEALLFATPEPLPMTELCRLTGPEEQPLPEDHVRGALRLLEQRLEGSALTIQRIAGGMRLSSRVEHAPLLKRMLSAQRNRGLSPAALETLSIVAYRQPCTRSQVDRIRGVDCGGVMLSLQERGLVKVCGRAHAPGRPYLYATTERFLEIFGLPELSDLPAIDPEADFSSLEPAANPTPAELPVADATDAPEQASASRLSEADFDAADAAGDGGLEQADEAAAEPPSESD